MKRKIIAIVLTVALVLSAVAVLAACQEEYTITFRRENATVLFTMKTSGGKLTEKAVKKAAEGNVPNREAEGYFFDNWYSTVSADEDGNYIYENPIDYDRVYTTRSDYYAGYERRKGDDRGYTLIGVIGDYTCWEPGDEPAEWMLTQDATEGWLYRITLDITRGNQIKVKTKTNEWDDTKTNLGWGGVDEVKLADGVTLPGSYKISDVIYGTGTGPMDNALVGVAVNSANVTIEYNARTNKFSFIINSVDMTESMPDVNYIIVGGFADADWNPSCQDEKYFFSDNGDGTYSLSISLIMGQEWKITKNDGTWGWQLTAADGVEIVGEDGLVVPADAFTDAGGNDHNFKTGYACEVTLTIDINARKLTILVKSIHVPEEGESVWPENGYAIVGNFGTDNALGSDGGAYYWKLPAPDNKFVFTRVGVTDIGTLTIDLLEGQQFKIAQNIAGYIGEINWNNASPFEVKSVAGDDVSGLFEHAGGGNIGVRADCNVSIIVDAKLQTIAISVNSVGEIPEINNDPDTAEWGLIGGFNGWGSDVMLTNQANGHKTLNYHFTGASEFKIRRERGWAISVGWHNDNISVVAGGSLTDSDIAGLFNEGSEGNMNVTAACTVEFDLIFINADTWTLVITVISLG